MSNYLQICQTKTILIRVVSLSYEFVWKALEPDFYMFLLYFSEISFTTTLRRRKWVHHCWFLFLRLFIPFVQKGAHLKKKKLLFTYFHIFSLSRERHKNFSGIYFTYKHVFCLPSVIIFAFPIHFSSAQNVN